MTRHEALKRVGLLNVEVVEAENCEPTNRMYDHEDGEIEWSASVTVNTSGLPLDQIYYHPVGGCNIKVYYYTDAEDAERVEECGGDWGILNWIPHHYEIG